MMRTHIALDVSNLDQAVDFYRVLFGVTPFRVLPGYAQFLLEDPTLNLALIEGHPTPHSTGHYGIEVPELTLVADMLSRIQASGLNPEVEADTLCCHARQEKFWVHDPDGHRWEVFWVRERFLEAPPDASGA